MDRQNQAVPQFLTHFSRRIAVHGIKALVAIQEGEVLVERDLAHPAGDLFGQGFQAVVHLPEGRDVAHHRDVCVFTAVRVVQVGVVHLVTAAVPFNIRRFIPLVEGIAVPAEKFPGGFADQMQGAVVEQP